MGKVESRRAYDAGTWELLRTAFASFFGTSSGPALRRDGLQGSGNTFRLRQNDVWGVVNFQRSMYSTAESVRFRVNVAATSDRLLRRHNSPPWPEGKPPSEADCVIRLDLDFFVRPAAGSWLLVDAQTDVAALGGAIVDDLRTFALPYLRSLSTGRAVDAELPSWTTVSRFRRAARGDARTLHVARYQRATLDPDLLKRLAEYTPSKADVQRPPSA
jgi:hypothetical protein